MTQHGQSDVTSDVATEECVLCKCKLSMQTEKQVIATAAGVGGHFKSTARDAANFSRTDCLQQNVNGRDQCMVVHFDDAGLLQRHFPVEFDQTSH